MQQKQFCKIFRISGELQVIVVVSKQWHKFVGNKIVI